MPNEKPLRLAEPAPAQSKSVAGAKPYTPAAISRWQRPSFAGFTPAQLSTILKQVQRGSCADWAHFCSHMTRTDAHLKALRDTRIMSIAGARWEVEAGYAPPGQEAVAEQAADFFRRELETTPSIEDLFANLVTAEDIGWSGAMHQWYRDRGEWHSAPLMIAASDIAFADDWVPIVRTWDANVQLPPEAAVRHAGGGTWLRTDAFQSGTWIMHVPGGIGETPNLAGDLHSIAWIWVFKHWTELWRQTSLERFANPFIYGALNQNASDVARTAMMAGLEALSGDHVGAFEVTADGGDPIRTLDVSTAAGTAHTEAIRHMDEQMSKALLGSTINVEVGNTGGNRSLGESQRDTTIIPRLSAYGRRLASTLERDWAKPLLRLNAHLFNGVVPPTPRLRFILVDEDKPEIGELQIKTGTVTNDEVRSAANLEPYGGAWGKQRAREVVPAEYHAQPTTTAPSQDGGEQVENAAASAMNGAQVQSLQSIVQSVADGSLPADAAIKMIALAFPITEEQAARMFEKVPGGTDTAIQPSATPVDSGVPAPVPEVANSAGPLSRRPVMGAQQSLPLMARRPKTSPTSSAYRTQIEAVPFSKSDGRES